MSGWISLHRKILDWEWYDDINVTRLFLHCILKANHTPKRWKGIDIDRGQFITSLDRLSSETGLSISQIRTCLKKLKSTREIASKSHTQHTVITIVSYDMYQCNDKPDSKQIAFESQTNNKRMTTTNNDNKENNEDNSYMSSAVAECPHQKIIDLYHETLPSSPRVKVWNETRKGYLRSRWREDTERQNLDYWKRLFEYISQSAFLTGKTEQAGRKPFLADLEWIVKPSNFVKIIEGKYES